jgi:hypothetical protein
MNARRFGLMMVLVGTLTLGATAVSAQQGRGRGPGPDSNPGQTQTQPRSDFGRGPENCPLGGDCLGQQTQAGAANRQGGRWASDDASATPGRGAGFGVPSMPLTDEIAAAMTAGWLDEVHAQAAYAGLIDQFGEVIPFVQLQRAEAQHQAAWERQFERFGLALPEAPAVTPLPAYASVAEACAAAVTIEQDNIGLYDDMLAAFEGYPTLTRVVTALRDASLNRHLPALEACAG